MKNEGGAKPLPTALALLAFVPLGLLLWWAVNGAQPEPARLDWAQLGFSVDERAGGALEDVAVVEAPDPVLVTREMAGRQGPLLGTLDVGRLHGDGAFVAVVREVAGATEVTEAPGVAGVVVALGGDGGFERCAFEEPVPLERFDEVAAEVGSDVHAATSDLTGRCPDAEPEVIVPLVRRVDEPLGALRRLAGQRAESALLPAGLAVVGAGGAVAFREDAGDGVATPVYPREVARQTLARAAPNNPGLDIGALGDPTYPVLARDGDGLWWVVPVSPPGDGIALAGLARTRADRAQADRLNPVVVTWLDDPLPGPSLLERRVLTVLGDAGEVRTDNLDELRVWLNVPNTDGAWIGHLAYAGRPLYRVTADRSGTVCVTDLDGHDIGCRGEG